MIEIQIDGKIIQATQGDNLLRVCLDNGIDVPHLCFIKEAAQPAASCRLCFVEIEGQPRPMTACTVSLAHGMVVHTDTTEVRKLQKAALQLLLSVHRVQCAKCPANRHCPLQDLAKKLGIGLKPKHLDQRLKALDVDTTHPFFDYYPNRCILCGKCIHRCAQLHKSAHLAFAGRGLHTVVSFFGNTATTPDLCQDCSACAEVCPVGALLAKVQE